MGKNRSWVLTRNYSGARFIVPTRGPMPGPSPAPGTAGDWGVEFRRSCVRMTMKQFVHLFHNKSSKSVLKLQ